MKFVSVGHLVYQAPTRTEKVDGGVLVDYGPPLCAAYMSPGSDPHLPEKIAQAMSDSPLFD